MIHSVALSNVCTRFRRHLLLGLLFGGLTISAPSLTLAQTDNDSTQPSQAPQIVSETTPVASTTAAIVKASTPPSVCGPVHPGLCLKDITQDQAGIWSSPLHIKPRDLFWLVPLAGATAVAFHYDAKVQQELGTNSARVQTSSVISRFGAPYTVFGEAGAFYAIGHLTHNDHLAETGRLGAEAIIDATLVSETLKLATNRERPDSGTGTGGFWAHGAGNLSDSFPSGHAIESWALARVIASEYRNPFVQFGAYGLASAISISRVTARRHFPSDALVGSALGYLIGGYVIHHHRSAGGLRLSVLPFADMSTHTFGASIAFRP